jgi:hypothetical protein
MEKLLRITAIALLLIDGIGAVYGGIRLISDPTGRVMEMPLELLKDSPFKDYLIPAIILLTFNGILNILFAILAVIRVKGYPWLIILAGSILVIWLTVQVIMLRTFYLPLHGTFYTIGILMIVLGAMLIKKKGG